MKVNFNKTIRDYLGNEVVNPENGEAQSFKDIVCARLFTAGDNLSADEKYEAYKIMQRIAASAERVEIEDKEPVLIKKVCEKSLTAGAYGQIVELLKGE